MIEIRINSPKGSFANVQVESREKAHAYIEKIAATGVWGGQEKWVRAENLTKEQLETLEAREVQGEFESYTEYKIEAEFTYELEDKSSEIAARDAANKAKRDEWEALLTKLANSNAQGPLADLIRLVLLDNGITE